MTTLVNGIKTHQTSVHDRGLLYGQSVFETIAVVSGKPLLLNQHIKRLEYGCGAIGIAFDQDTAELLKTETRELCRGQTKSVLRITLTMGAGGRGYRNPETPATTRILSIYEYPHYPTENWNSGIELGLVSLRLGLQPMLAGVKHGNRIEQTIARSQWQSTWQEALVRDHQDNVVEATQSNVFIVKDGQLLTPKIDQCGVAGIIRDYLLNNAHQVGVHAETVSLSVPDIKAADEVFVTNSLIGLWPVKGFQTTRYHSFRCAHKLLKFMTDDEVIPHN